MKSRWLLPAVPLAFVAVALSLAATRAAAQQPAPAPSVPTGTPRYGIFHGPPYASGEGEPSIGVNWNCTSPPCAPDFSGTVMYQYGFNSLWITFDDCASPAVPSWANRSNPSNSASEDPIGFVDRYTGRAFASQLAGGC